MFDHVYARNLCLSFFVVIRPSNHVMCVLAPDHATLAEQQAGLARLVRQLDASNSVAESRAVVATLSVRPYRCRQCPASSSEPAIRRQCHDSRGSLGTTDESQPAGWIF